MSNLEDLKRKISTAKDLRSVVKTMKALAAVSIRQYEKAVISLSEYDRTLEMGLQILLKKNPEILLTEKPLLATDRLAVVVFGSDWGMCGQFNEKIAQYTTEHLNSLPFLPANRLILTVGARVRDRIAAKKIETQAYFPVPSSIAGITQIVREIVLTLETWRQENRVSKILLFRNYPFSGTAYRQSYLQIFPLNSDWLKQLKQRKWPSRCLPTFTMQETALASALFRQYFFVSLYRACAESLASENASRLLSMQMAEKNISERLSELNLEFNHQRQTAITSELLDIVSGFEALSDRG